MMWYYLSVKSTAGPCYKGTRLTDDGGVYKHRGSILTIVGQTHTFNLWF